MLPRIDTPIYELILPVSKIKTKYRPFLVKEQKILLMAIQSDDSQFTQDNIKQIIRNCCLSEINIDELSSTDIEYFFLQLRARSIGEILEAKYRCENVVDGEPCKNLMAVNINLLDIEVDTSKYSDIVKITESVGIKLKCPNFKTLEILQKNGDVVNKAFDIVKNCIEYIFDENNFYYKHEVSDKELDEFMDSLSVDKFKEIENFFNNIPKLTKDVDVKCSKCGYEHKIHLEGLQNFLG